jgi:hypothetical protein
MIKINLNNMKEIFLGHIRIKAEIHIQSKILPFIPWRLQLLFLLSVDNSSVGNNV